MKPASVPEKSTYSNRIQPPAKIVNDHQAAVVNSELVVAHNTNGKTESFEEVKTGDRTRTLETRVPCNNSEISKAQNVPIVVEDATKMSKEDVMEISMCPPLQAHGVTTENLVKRNHQNGLHVQGYHPGETLPAPSTQLPRPEFRVEVSRAMQGQVNIYQQPPRPEMPQGAPTRGPPPLRPRIQEVSSINSLVTGQHQGYYPQTLTESPRLRRPQFSSAKWISQRYQPNQQAQLLQASGPSDGHLQPYPAVNHGPSGQAKHRSTADNPRGPPNVSLFHPPKRRRVGNHPAKGSLQMHVVASNSNYVMHNFRVQKSPWTVQERVQQNGQTSGPLPTNQVVYTTSPSNPSTQIPGTYLSQGTPKSQPSAYPEKFPAPNRPPVGVSQGQLVERVVYPSTAIQPGSSECHSGPRVMTADHRSHNERERGTDQPAESNGTVYVIQEYQVLNIVSLNMYERACLVFFLTTNE